MRMSGLRGVAALAALLVAAASPALAEPRFFGSRAANGLDGPSDLVTVDASTGATTFVGSIGFDDVDGMDFHPFTGVLYAAGKRPGTATEVLLTIDRVTGQGTEVGEITGTGGCSFANSCPSLAFDESGGLYAFVFKSLYIIDHTTGEATFVGNSSGAAALHSADFSPGNVLYAGTDSEGGLFTIDTANGNLLSQVFVCLPGEPCGGIYQLHSLTFDPASGTLYGAMNDDCCAPQNLSLVSVDPATGDMAILGSLPDGVRALALDAPELIVNGGFEGGNCSPWLLGGNGSRCRQGGPFPHGGTGYVEQGGGVNRTGRMYQQVAIPPGSPANLTYWLNIATSESGPDANDSFRVEVRNTANVLLSTVATYSNLDAKPYEQEGAFTLSAFAGQTIRLYFRSSNNGSLPTTFRLDDVSLR